ncbi:MAG: 3-deoxy-7-phosphoheptulonate synthase, partial [Planctomycetota bacterium]
MLIVLKQNATAEDVQSVCRAVEELGLSPHPIPGKLRTAIGVTGNVGPVNPTSFSSLECVADVIRVTRPYKLTNREMQPEDTVIRVGDVEIGGPDVVVIAGPCSVESHEQTVALACELKARGANLLRGGAFKPRTSPYTFQGLGEDGLKILAEARQRSGMPVVSELLATEETQLVEE